LILLSWKFRKVSNVGGARAKNGGFPVFCTQSTGKKVWLQTNGTDGNPTLRRCTFLGISAHQTSRTLNGNPKSTRNSGFLKCISSILSDVEKIHRIQTRATVGRSWWPSRIDARRQYSAVINSFSAKEEQRPSCQLLISGLRLQLDCSWLARKWLVCRCSRRERHAISYSGRRRTRDAAAVRRVFVLLQSVPGAGNFARLFSLCSDDH